MEKKNEVLGPAGEMPEGKVPGGTEERAAVAPAQAPLPPPGATMAAGDAEGVEKQGKRMSGEEVEELVARWTEPQQKAGRVQALDTLRGFSVVSMVLYHAIYNLVILFGMPAAWFSATPGYIWQQSICWVFLLVSGASQHFGRRPYRRGLIVLGCGMAITLITWIAMPEQRIMFGILHCIGLCMIITAAIKPVLHKLPPTFGFYLAFILFLLLKGVPQGFIGIGDAPIMELPRALYSTPILFPLGLPGQGFFSSDYFPLIPWLFLYLTGWFFWEMAGDFAKTSTKKGGPLSWIGRHSLEIYMLHQPVLYGGMWLLQKAGILTF